MTSGSRLVPDFLIVGAQRCGTTSLFRTLAKHPAIAPPLWFKGVHFFDTADHYAKGFSWYRGHFPLSVRARRSTAPHHPRTGEASPYYAFHPLAAQRIATALPEVRVVMLLRDPVERAFSAFKQEVGRGFETEPFERALDLEAERLAGEEARILADPTYQSFHHQHHAYVARGEYAGQVRRLQATLGPSQVLALDADAYFASPAAGWNRLLDHLDLPSWAPPSFDHVNARPSAPMPTSVRRRLSEHFAPYDDKLAVLLGHELSWRR